MTFCWRSLRTCLEKIDLVKDKRSLAYGRDTLNGLRHVRVGGHHSIDILNSSHVAWYIRRRPIVHLGRRAIRLSQRCNGVLELVQRFAAVHRCSIRCAQRGSSSRPSFDRCWSTRDVFDLGLRGWCETRDRIRSHTEMHAIEKERTLPMEDVPVVAH